MKLQTRSKLRLMYKMCMALLAGSMLYACGSDSGGDDPDPVNPTGPALTVNPTDITFTYEKGSSRELSIKTEATWRIAYTPAWLTASSSGGNGATTITFTTTSENASDEPKADQVEIEATNSDGGKTSVKVDVTQLEEYQKNCYGQVNEGAVLVMTYGFACAIECGNNTQYFYWTILPESDYNNIKGNNAQIIESSKKWSRVNVPSELATEIIYDGCQANTSYYLVTVGYASNGLNGRIDAYSFTTKSAEGPLAEATPNADVVTEVHGGDTGPWYKWEVKKSGTCAAYYTYVCASDKELATMKNRKGAYGKYEAKDGIYVAWEIWKEHKSNQFTHTTTFNTDNANGREQLFEAYLESATQWLTAKTSDKYLQIVTWGVDRSNNYSGLVYNVVYRIENGKVTGGTVAPADPSVVGINDYEGDKDLDMTYNTTVSTNTVVLEPTGDSKSIAVTSNDTWTATSNQSWCSVSPASGANNGNVTIAASANNSSTTRQATVTVTTQNGAQKLTISVSQAGSKFIGRNDYDGDKDLN